MPKLTSEPPTASSSFDPARRVCSTVDFVGERDGLARPMVAGPGTDTAGRGLDPAGERKKFRHRGNPPEARSIRNESLTRAGFAGSRGSPRACAAPTSSRHSIRAVGRLYTLVDPAARVSFKYLIYNSFDQLARILLIRSSSGHPRSYPSGVR
jgi:hypothetical protein